MSDYLEIFYDKNNKPYTSYPEKFVSHIFQKYEMKEGQSLLELGVGRGEHLRLFNKSGLNVSGLDISKKSKELCPDMDIRVLDADSEVWPYPDNSFDFVYSKSFVEHLQQPTKYFLEALRVLKPGGVIITLTPSWQSQYKTFFDDYTHVSPFTLVSLKNISFTSSTISSSMGDSGQKLSSNFVCVGSLLNVLDEFFNTNLARLSISALTRPINTLTLKIVIASQSLL